MSFCRRLIIFVKKDPPIEVPFRRANVLETALGPNRAHLVTCERRGGKSSPQAHKPLK